MRICPFHDCGRMISDAHFACLRHWRCLSARDRTEAHAAYGDYTADRIGVEELRARQQAVLGPRGDAKKNDVL